MKTIGTVMLAAAALLAPGPARAQTAPTLAPAMKCADMVGWKIPGSTMVIAKATAVSESPANTVQYMPPFPMKVAVAIPSHCKIEGELDRRVGKGGIHYAIGFAVSLPDRWNGRFLFQGGGGFNGSVLPPIGTAAAGSTPGLARGFAVVSTDDGHKGTIWDTSFMADANADGIQQLTDTVHWTELNSFFAHGGKVLYYHGISAPYFSALDTLDYYQRMAKASGGLDTVRAQSSRFYFVPGMLHCRGGPSLDSFDLLTAVVDWVEKGNPPKGVVATGAAFPGRSRRLCPWPEHAQYKGAGNTEDAANFACQE